MRAHTSPVRTKEFKKYWTKLEPVIKEKKGFDESWLKNLEIICNLYVLYDRMTIEINDGPLTFENEGRYGLQQRVNVLISERQKVIGEIRHFSKLLGMKIDSEPKEEKPQSNWE